MSNMNKATNFLLLLTVLIVALTLPLKTTARKCHRNDAEDNDFTPRAGIESLPQDCGKHKVRALRGMTRSDRISGGYAADEGEFPSFVHINSGNSSRHKFCGGTILDERRILTAAQCVTSFDDDNIMAESIYVTPALLRPEKKFEIGIKASKICKSKSFGFMLDFMINDVAIIQLEKDLTFNEQVQPACLPRTDMTVKHQGYSVGLGRVDGEFWAHKLQVLPTKLKQCSYHESILCFQSNNKKYVGDICVGDSGSGVYFLDENKQLTVAALASFGKDICESGTRQQAGYANVHHLRSEINSLLEECS